MEMSKEAREAYRAYHRNRYANNPKAQKFASNKYWYNRACKELNKDAVSEEEVKQIRCDYYKQYRKDHTKQIHKSRIKFWESTVKEGE